MRQEFYRATIYVRGIKKRARNIALHGLNLGKFPIETRHDFQKQNEVRAIAFGALEANIREIIGPQDPEIVFSYCYTYDDSPGIETMEPFSDHGFRIKYIA